VGCVVSGVGAGAVRVNMHEPENYESGPANGIDQAGITSKKHMPAQQCKEGITDPCIPDDYILSQSVSMARF